MFTYVIWAIVIYLLIRFIFNFVIPIFKATRQMRQQVKEFQDRMGNQATDFQSAPKATSAREKNPREGDYIEFEEIK
jgi:hypothetical protein